MRQFEPQPFSCAWPQLLRRLRRGHRLALFTDFDGTLVRIRRRKHGAQLSRELRGALRRLSRAGALVGVISGRRLDDVTARVGVEGIWFAGVHGYFLRDPGNRTCTRVNLRQREQIARARRVLDRRLAGLRGIFVEPKVATVAVHYRGAPREHIARARRALTEVLQQIPGLHLMSGKSVWELFPNPRPSKWDAIRFILARERGFRRPQPRELVFLGDDTTDEQVFSHMGGHMRGPMRAWSVVVGRRRRTAARFYLRSPAEVGQFLLRLAEVIR